MLTIHGYPLNSSKAIRAVIEDMRKTVADPTMVLDMGSYATRVGEVCHACAGGSAVIHGMGAERNENRWTSKENAVASYFNSVRIGSWGLSRQLGYPIPESAQSAWSRAMVHEENSDFFPSWERFADAVEAAEKEVE